MWRIPEYHRRWQSMKRALEIRRPPIHRILLALALISLALPATPTAYCDFLRPNPVIHLLLRFQIALEMPQEYLFASNIKKDLLQIITMLINVIVVRSLNCCSAYPRKLIEIQEKERDSVGRAVTGSLGAATPSDDLWLECDDEVIRILRVHELEELLSRKPRTPNVTPYLLFYVQVNMCINFFSKYWRFFLGVLNVAFFYKVTNAVSTYATRVCVLQIYFVIFG